MHDDVRCVELAFAVLTKDFCQPGGERVPAVALLYGYLTVYPVFKVFRENKVC